MFREWDQARQRKEMAQQTLDGASAEALVREAKFKGAIDFIGGLGATWEYNAELRQVIVTPGTVEEWPEGKPTGHGVSLDGKMSAKQMRVVVGAQTRRRK